MYIAQKICNPKIYIICALFECANILAYPEILSLPAEIYLLCMETYLLHVETYMLRRNIIKSP